MAGEWNTVPLNELYEFSSGLSKPSSAFGSGYPFLSFKDVFYNTFVPKELSELVNSTEKERVKCSIRRGDVFLTRTSETMDELGMSCVALRDIPDATFNGFTKRLRPKVGDRVLPEYAGYFFRGPAFRQAVTAMSSMSTRASLNNEMLARLSIVLPSIAEQEAIGRILGTLDDKIELNRRMNETLEAISRALFKSWFVDFDPVRAKAERRDPGLPKPHADLFPDSFEDSELGEIPKGWVVGTVGDIGSRIVDKVDSPTEWQSEHLIDLSRMPQKAIALADWGLGSELTTSVTRFNARDTLFGAIRPYFHKVGIAPMNGVTNISVFVVRAKEKADWPFVAMLCSMAMTVDYATRVAKGTKMPVVSWPDFAKGQIPIPPANVRNCLNHIVASMLDQIIANVHESQTLSAVRDTLLPKLISGELRVPVTEFVAVATA